MKVKFTIYLLVLLLFSVGQSTMFGGTTGKITGKITDAENGEPLAGVNISKVQQWVLPVPLMVIISF